MTTPELAPTQEKVLSVEPQTFPVWRRALGRVGLAAGLLLGSSTVAEVVHEGTPAYAADFTNDYPNMNAVDHNVSAYEWWVDENGDGKRQVTTDPHDNDELMSSRGYYYRNCTDGVAYWASKYMNKNVSGWGNAAAWNENAVNAGYTVKAGNSNAIETGDIAQSDDSGGWGHVGLVTNVTKNSDGVVTSIKVAELNKMRDGTFTQDEYNSRNSLGNLSRGSSNNDWDHFIDVNGAGIGLNGAETGGGSGGVTHGSVTVGVYDPSNGWFHIRDSNTPGPAGVSFNFGNASWVPLAGDWNHDGEFTPGAYDPATGWFYLRNSKTSGPADTSFQYGNIGWQPIAGDWNGNGYWSVGLYDPSTGTFYLRDTNSAGGADYVFGFGNAGWKPIAGDWDGNGSTTIGAYNPNTATFYLNNQHDGSAAENTIQYGNIGWEPLAGDWDGNRYWSIGAYDPNGAVFYLRNMNTSGPADVTLQYGNAGWKPIVGDWDGQ